jgi:hypothetical protein
MINAVKIQEKLNTTNDILEALSLIQNAELHTRIEWKGTKAYCFNRHYLGKVSFNVEDSNRVRTVSLKSLKKHIAIK